MSQARELDLHSPAKPPAEVAVVDGDALMAVIARAAADPNTDVDKLERLMAMAERREAHRAEQSFHEAMNAAQSEMKPVAADANNPQTRSAYATYAALDKKLRPIYARHGFSLSFDTDAAPQPDHIRILCYCSHSSGHSRTYRVDMPADGKGAKGGDVMTKTHATGAAMTYGQRYLLKMIFNMVVGEDDDNGGDTAGTGCVSEDQLDKVRTLIERTGANVEKFCEVFKIDALPSLRQRDYPQAIQMLNLKEKKVRA